MGALAAGAVAAGACAIGALAIGHLAIRTARIKHLWIDELTIRNVRDGRASGFIDGTQSDSAEATAEVAEEYVALCRRGEFDEAMARYFSADHVRIESRDMIEPPAEIRGMEAIKESGRAFTEANEIHGFDVKGPFVGENQFAARFSIDATSIPTGRRTKIRKLDLYTVHDGSIVRSEIYYNTPPF
jgi:ketosteroid isomerase-like protein